MRISGTTKRARWIGAAVALLLAAGAVTAASRNDADTSAARSDLGPTAAAGQDEFSETDAVARPLRALSGTGGGAESVIADTGAAVVSGAGGGAAPSVQNGVTGPRIVKRGELRVEVKEGGFRAAFDRATALASSHGGFVASSTSRTNDEGDDGRLAAGTLVLRVPATAFDTVRAALAGLGDVAGESVEGEDVSGQLVDLDARIRSLQVEEEALRALMARAKTVGETIEVQQQLTRVRQDTEQLQSRKAFLEDAAALSTVHVELFEPGVATTKPDTSNRLTESFADAVDGTLAVLGGTVVVVGYVLPLALLALLGWALWRLATRRTRLAV